MSIEPTIIIRPLAPEPQTPTDKGGGLFSGDTPSFEDVLDAINPLQHLPVVSSIYRSESGDGMSIFSRLIGGMLFGGPIGFLAAAVNAGVEAATGSDIGEHVMAMFEDSTPPTTQMADVAEKYASTQQLT